jgi:sec-independent protein translocase protein TatA
MGDLLSPSHVILIAFVVFFLFGGKKIPELMRGLGRGIREFKDAKDKVQREIEDHVNEDRKTTSTT